MEPAGLTLGAIPLIVMTFQGYRGVRGFMLQYNSLDHNLRKVLRDITTAEGLFKGAVDLILSDVVDEDRREIMLGDLESEHWRLEGLGNELHSVLGHLFQPVVNSIQGVQEAVEGIKKILLELGRIHSNSPLEILAAGARKTLGFVKMDSPLSSASNVKISSRRKKLKIIAGDTTVELKDLLQEMKEHNSSLLNALHCRTSRKTTLRAPHRYSKLPQVLPLARTAGSSICGGSKALLNPRAMQIASNKLYGIVSKKMPCQCHILHLRLEKPAEDRSEPPTIEPTTDFSFLLAAKCGDESGREPTNTIVPMIPFVFTSSICGSTSIIAEDHGSKRICEELLASNGEYERYFRDNDGDGRSGFLLRRASTQTTPTIDSDLISLEELVSSGSDRLTQYNRLKIAANLVYSILPFYASPWIRKWNLESIRFIGAQGLPVGTSNPAQWTPHVSLTIFSDKPQFGASNEEIRELGLMLLGLGRGKHLVPSYEGEDIKDALRKAVRDLIERMGFDYARIVERCLNEWSKGDVDLMKEENLNEFLSELSLLEERVRNYSPRTWSNTGMSSGLAQCVM